MAIRVLKKSNDVPEKVQRVGVTGVVVRWDFVDVVTKMCDKDGNEIQGKEIVETEMSEMGYVRVPSPERVIADIEADINVRYGNEQHPDIDMEYYRTAIEALSK